MSFICSVVRFVPALRRVNDKRVVKVCRVRGCVKGAQGAKRVAKKEVFVQHGHYDPSLSLLSLSPAELFPAPRCSEYLPSHLLGKAYARCCSAIGVEDTEEERDLRD